MYHIKSVPVVASLRLRYAMPTYEDLIELANICARHARAAANKDVATLLSNMAKEYSAEATKLQRDRPLNTGGERPRFS